MLFDFLSCKLYVFYEHLTVSSYGHCSGSSLQGIGGFELGSVGSIETCLMKYLA